MASPQANPTQSYWWNNLTQGPVADNRTSCGCPGDAEKACATGTSSGRIPARRHLLQAPLQASFAAGSSNFRKRQTTELGRIADSGLRYFNDLLCKDFDLLCKDFGHGIGPVAELERSQTILIGGSERSNVLGGEGRILQEPVDGHDDCPMKILDRRERQPSPLPPCGRQRRVIYTGAMKRRLNRGCGRMRQKTHLPAGGAAPTRPQGLTILRPQCAEARRLGVIRGPRQRSRGDANSSTGRKRSIAHPLHRL